VLSREGRGLPRPRDVRVETSPIRGAGRGARWCWEVVRAAIMAGRTRPSGITAPVSCPCGGRARHEFVGARPWDVGPTSRACGRATARLRRRVSCAAVVVPSRPHNLCAEYRTLGPPGPTAASARSRHPRRPRSAAPSPDACDDDAASDGPAARGRLHALTRVRRRPTSPSP
jgi:hypothetical protein